MNKSFIDSFKEFFAPIVREPTPVEEILAFENRYTIKLPEAYVEAVTSLSILSSIDALINWSQPYDEEDMPPDFLSSPFPHQDAWNDKSLFSKELGWRSPYYAKSWFQGSMRIVNTGCESYVILVISGPCRGQLWRDQRACDAAGIFPICDRHGKRLKIDNVWKGLRLKSGTRSS